MAHNAVSSITALTVDDSLEPSQNKLLFLMQEHGLGVTTGSPILGNAAQSSITAALTRTATLWKGPSSSLRQVQVALIMSRFKNAFDASADAQRHHVDDGGKSTSSASRPHQQLSRPRSAALPPSETNPFAQTHSQPALRHSRSAENLSPLIRDVSANAVSAPVAEPNNKKKKRRSRAMHSQSPTQPNECRSYDQYDDDDDVDDNSQHSSRPPSPTQGHLTLQEGDTGYVDLKFDLPDTAPFEVDSHSLPETPATLPTKSFLSGGDEDLIAPSQLFDQTQPTSALKKISPTSSRPSPNVLRTNIPSSIPATSSPLVNRGAGASSPDCNQTPFQIPRHSPQLRNRGLSRSTSPTVVLDSADDRDRDEDDNLPLARQNVRRGRTQLEPINKIRHHTKRNLNPNATRSSSQDSFDSDFDESEAERRRQRARLRKERASRSFPDISLSISTAKVEVPSTNRNKGPKSSNDPKQSIGPHNGKFTATENVDSQETVSDSQSSTDLPPVIDQSDDLPLHTAHHRRSSNGEQNQRSIAAMRVLEEEEIPETSPVYPLTERSKTAGDVIQVESSAPSGPTSSANAVVEASDPVIRTRPETKAPVGAGVKQRKPDPIEAESSPTVIVATSEQNTTQPRGGLSRSLAPSRKVPEALETSSPSVTSSPVTVLTATPNYSPDAGPNSEEDKEPETPDNITVAVPSRNTGRTSMPRPLSSANPRKRTATSGKSRGSGQNTGKGVRQSSRRDSLVSSKLDESIISVARTPRSGTRNTCRKFTILRDEHGIFEGMVFAISLQQRQQQPHRGKDKPLSKGSLEDMIRSEGGTILDDGFNSLFEFDTLQESAQSRTTPVLSNLLKLHDDTVGFAALIADGHSRKVKYMQALALGIPCLAPRWITTCVSKKEIVDWSSYLLCAGPSSLLGDAIRSRNLIPYDAKTAKLVDVVAKRPKLLDDSRILLIMKKNKNDEKRLPYVFLAQVLGASLVRVQSVEDAKMKLRDAEERGEGFDWVYVNDQIQDAKTALFGDGERSSKKRGRAEDVEDQSPAPKRIRTLSDELVVQSLILGRLIEEGELEE